MAEENKLEGWNEVVAEMSEMHDFEAEKSVAGKLAQVRRDVGPNNSTIIVLEKSDGTLVSFWANSVLETRFEKIVAGTECRVEFLGMVESKNGRQYKNYKVWTK